MGRWRSDTSKDAEHGGRRPGRRLVLLLVVAATILFVVRRNQRKAEIDEGVWHEAPPA